MPNELVTGWGIAGALALVVAAVGFVVGGIRFRRWALEGRIGTPRFPAHVETVLVWLVYSVGVALVIVLTKQVLREL